MRTRRSRIVLVALLMQFAIALAVSSTPASACSCVPHSHWGFVVPKTGRLPANAVGIPLYSPKDRSPQHAPEEIVKKVTVEIEEDGVFHAVPAMARELDGWGMYVVGPKGGLKAGSTYRFTDRASRRADEAPRTVVVKVDYEALEADTSLIAEAHSLRPRLEFVSAGAICSQEVWVSRTRVITLLPDAPPEWLEQLLYVTVVDGDRSWVGAESICHVVPPGRSRIQTGWSLLYAKCPPPPGIEDPAFLTARTLSSGPHTVQVQASLPGTNIMLNSPTVTVDLSCQTE